MQTAEKFPRCAAAARPQVLGEAIEEGFAVSRFVTPFIGSV